MLTSQNGDGMVMPVAPMYGGGNGYGNGVMGDGSFWIIVLFIFALMGNWGNGYGGNAGNGAVPYMMNMNTGSEVQRGFDQQAVMSGLASITASLNSLAMGQCNGFSNVVNNMNMGFANAESSAAARQMANLQQQFAMQTAIDGRLDTLAMNQQNYCCENRAAVADLKYAMAQEGAATRSNTDAKTQAIMDKLCQLELDGIKQNYENRIAGMQNQIDDLRTNLGNARTDASQNALANRILADNAAQTMALEQYLNPSPIPAYPVQNPNCCANQGWSTCGCGA